MNGEGAAKVDLKGLKIAILIISLMSLSPTAIASVIADIRTAFPGMDDVTAQFLSTAPNIFIPVTGFAAAALSRKLSQKKIMALSMILIGLPSILGFLFHKNVVLLFCWAGTLGVGLGIQIPVLISIIPKYYFGNEKDDLIGKFSSSQNFGGIFLTVAGGLLAMIGWHYVYLVYLLAVPGIILAFIYIPDEKISPAKDDRDIRNARGRITPVSLGIDKVTIMFAVIQFCFTLNYGVASSNFALMLEDAGQGSSGLAGLLAGLYLFGSIVSGWFFGKINIKIKKQTITLGFCLLGVSLLAMALWQNLVIYIVFSVIGGMSFSLVVPQDSISIMENKVPGQFAFANAFLVALGASGSFLSPVITSLAVTVTGSDKIAYRLIFSAILCAVFAVAAFVVLLKYQRRNSYEDASRDDPHK